jgi:dienelactone hydrolase
METMRFRISLVLALCVGACGGESSDSLEPADEGAVSDVYLDEGVALDSGSDHQVFLSDVGEDLVAIPDTQAVVDVNTSTGSDASPAIDLILPLDEGAAPEQNPGESGPFTFTFVEVSDLSEVSLDVYVPVGLGPFEVVVLTHGFQLAPKMYSHYGEHLSSWGYVVILPQMPGSLFNAPTHVALRDHVQSILDWVEASVDDADHPLFALAKPGKVGLAGHSMGGKISILTATEDVRVRSVFAIDPVDAAGGPFGGPTPENPSVTPELMNQITVPIVLLGETTNGTSSGLFGQACAPEEDNFHQYYLHAESPALEIEMVGAYHMSFIDTAGCGLTCSVCPAGTDDAEVTKQRTAQYMTAFFNRTLRGQVGYDQYLTGAAMLEDVSAGLVKIESKNGF